MIVKLPICLPCAAKLRAILKERGEHAMGEALGETLCEACLKRMPGYVPGQRPTTKLKRWPTKPAGTA